MLTEAIRLTVFPAVYGVRRLERSVHNDDRQSRVALFWSAALCCLAALGGMSAADVSLACRRRGLRSRCHLRLVRLRLGSAAAMPKLAGPPAVLWIGFRTPWRVSALCVAARRRADAAAPPVFAPLPLPRMLVGRQWAERLHRRGGWCAVRHRARGGRALVVYPQTEWMTAAGV